VKDTFGREIEPGHLVAYASDSAGPSLSVARVLGPCEEKGSHNIRVRVLQSNTMAFINGITGKREPGMPYVTFIGCPDRCVIMDAASIPADVLAKEAM